MDMRNQDILEPEGTGTAFESDIQRSLSAVQAAVTAAVESLPTYPRKAPELARQLGLERNVAWKLFRLMNERDVFAAARFVPGQASIAAFVSAAAEAGVPGKLLEKVTGATHAYSRVVQLHAGDRASADIMLGGRTGEAGESALRRSAFRSMSFLAGAQAEAQLKTFLMAPAADGSENLDGVSLNGFVELRRMRADAPVVIGRPMATDDRGKVLKAIPEETIDGPLPEGECMPLLRDYCSKPLPRFRLVQGEWGFMETELVGGPVGKTGAITFMTADVVRGLASRYRSEQNMNMDLVARIRTPTAVLICDVLAHAALFGEMTPRVAVYSDLFGDALRRGPGRERYSLSSVHRVEFLGQGLGRTQTPEIPRYTRMLQYVMDRLSWDGAQFNTYRVRIELPFTPTSMVVSFDLLDRPNGGA
jgi:hypothetical protein